MVAQLKSAHTSGGGSASCTTSGPCLPAHTQRAPSKTIAFTTIASIIGQNCMRNRWTVLSGLDQDPTFVEIGRAERPESFRNSFDLDAHDRSARGTNLVDHHHAPLIDRLAHEEARQGRVARLGQRDRCGSVALGPNRIQERLQGEPRVGLRAGMQ